ncbi:MAG: argininosuccinate lyase, partial [Verrucomicrobiota bacterium]
DLQEDKERVFDTADTVRSCLRLMAGMIRNTSAKPEVCARASADPQLLATDLADHLVLQGVPFRQAHHLVGAVVALAETAGKPLDAITTEEFRSISTAFGDDIGRVFELRRAMAKRTSTGAPGTAGVRRRLAAWSRRLK